MKKVIIVTLFSSALAFIGLWGCEPSEVLNSSDIFFVIDGDTVKLREDLSLKGQNIPKAAGDPAIVIETKTMPPVDKILAPVSNYVLNEKEIKNQSTMVQTELNYIAFGSSFAAGVVNGGYNNSTMETSYPNLIARQLKLKNFKQPKFDNQNFNGFSSREVAENNDFTKGPFRKFVAANNNLATPGNATVNRPINNFAIPFIGRRAILFQSENSRNLEGLEYRYLDRIFNSSHNSVYDYNKNANPDFYTLENGFDDLLLLAFDNMSILLTYASYARNSQFPESLTSSAEIRLVSLFDSKGQEKKENSPKGFIATIPDLSEFPVCNLKTYDDGVKELGFHYFYYRNINGTITEMRPGERFLPTSAVDSLFGKNVNMALKKGLTEENPLDARDIFYRDKIKGVELYVESLNIHYNFLTEKYGIHLVDLNTLFSKVIKGEYITWDGNRADASYYTGNFFNEDGLSLTPFGQSIVANAFLSKMNEIYKTNIPLISTSFYLTQDQLK